MWSARATPLHNPLSGIDIAQTGSKRRCPWGAGSNVDEDEIGDDTTTVDTVGVPFGSGGGGGGGGAVVRGAFGSGRGRGAVPLATLWDGGLVRTAPLSRASASALSPSTDDSICCSCNKSVNNTTTNDVDGSSSAPCAHCERAACDSCLTACDRCANIYCLSCGIKKSVLLLHDYETTTQAYHSHTPHPHPHPSL